MKEDAGLGAECQPTVTEDGSIVPSNGQRTVVHLMHRTEVLGTVRESKSVD